MKPAPGEDLVTTQALGEEDGDPFDDLAPHDPPDAVTLHPDDLAPHDSPDAVTMTSDDLVPGEPAEAGYDLDLDGPLDSALDGVTVPDHLEVDDWGDLAL